MSFVPTASPRHKIRAFSSVAETPAEPVYRRLVNYLAETSHLQRRQILEQIEERYSEPFIRRHHGKAASNSSTAVQTDFAHAIDESESTEDVESISVFSDDAANFSFDSLARMADGIEAQVGRESSLETRSDFLDYAQELLESWFNNGHDETSIESVFDSDDTDCAVESDEVTDSADPGATELLLKLRMAVEPGLRTKPAEPTIADVSETKVRTSGGAIAALSVDRTSETHAPSRRNRRSRSTDRSASRQPYELRSRVVPTAGGGRKELFPNGSVIAKSEIGRVKEVRCSAGAIISFRYDMSGRLESFLRTDMKGNVHSSGERDKDGVVVRDADGRVKAQGESMSVDARGTLTVRRFDGQFWSFDMVRGIHIERRILQDVDGNWNSMTALLTADGFRMATRFQRLKEQYRRFGDWLSDGQSSQVRFYGRDGSAIQFDSDEDLESIRPARIWPPGSRDIDNDWTGLRQAASAWDSVYQYVSQYLFCL